MRIQLVLLFCLLPALASDRRAILERARELEVFPGQQIPQATPEILKQAEAIAGGAVFFYGSTPVQVGLKGIDWSGAHIRHQEWPAQLNRFFHLIPLAAAFRQTRQERYARAARAYIEDWLAGDPYATAASLRPGDNTLNMSIRLGTSVHSGWGGVLPVFLDSPLFDDAFLGRILASLSHQAGFLSRNLTASGNWRISQLDALVFTALRYPFLPNAGGLLETGVTGMRNALATQFLPDGVHNERTPGYAEWMTQVAANYYDLGRRFPQARVPVDPQVLVRSLDYGAQSELFGVNDSVAPRRDPPELARLKWRAELVARLKLEAPAEPPLDQVFPIAGQVFSRTAWKPGADYLALDASTWGGGHGHLSRLGIVFRSAGRVLVADPGILSYEMSNPLGPYGKSTAAHSTLNLDGGNQSGADAALLRSVFTPSTALLQARYQGGYWKGPFGWSFSQGRGQGAWGDHERLLFWVKGEYLVVIDSMISDPGAGVRSVWQLGPMDKWSHDPKELRWWSQNPDANLHLEMIVPPEGASMEVLEGRRDPPRGWVGARGNDALAAPLVEFRYPAPRSGRTLSIVLLAAASGRQAPRFRLRAYRETPRASIHHLEIERPGGALDHLAWSNSLTLPVDDARPFTSDGPFVGCRMDSAGRLSGCFVLEATYLNHGGARIFEDTARRSGLVPR